MALRKPLFMQTEGYSEEMAATDSIALGALSMGGNIDMTNTGKIVNLVDPTAAQDGATKAYVDAVAQSLAIKDPVLVLFDVAWEGRANVQAVSVSNISSLNGLPTIDGRTLTDGQRALLTNQTTQSQNGIWVVHSGPWTRPTDFTTGGHAATVYVIADNSPSYTGTYSNTRWVCTNVAPTDVIDTDNLTFIQTLEGLLNVIDGINVDTDGYRVLISDIDGDALVDAGIWVAHSGVWTRPADFNTGAHAAHAFCFVEEGTNFADTGWVCTTNPPNDVIGTNPLSWVQFSAAGQISAGSGLQKVGNVISVKKGDGIEIVSNGAATNIDLATNPGLTLTGTSPNKKLAALIASNEGLQIDGANGLALLLNGTTLQVGVSGVSVKGLPPSFEINGLATHYATPGTGQVTSANLDTLTAGSSSNADSLHTHSLPSVPYANAVQASYAVSEAITAADPLCWSATNDRVARGDASNDSKSRVIGVAQTGQATVGNAVPVVTAGPCAGVLSSATVGTPYYLQSGGGLGTSLPGAGKRIIRVGIAKNASDLFVQIVDYGKKAA